MYELSVDSKFAAAHCLRSYQGKCARLHGHTFQVTATLRANTVDDIGMCIDFVEISGMLNEIVERFDHQTLNDLEEFADSNPTSENLAKIIFDRLSEKFNHSEVHVRSVTVAESEKYRVTYRKDETV